jgi:hypothetical protein
MSSFQVVRKYNSTPFRYRNLGNPNSWHNRNRRSVQSHARRLIKNHGAIIKAKLAARRRRRAAAEKKRQVRHLLRFGRSLPRRYVAPARRPRPGPKTARKFVRNW